MTNAASTRGLARQAQQRKDDLRDEALVITDLMRTEHGRRWMWLRLSECGVFHGAASLDHASLAYTAGTRTVGLGLLAQITRHAPDAYIRMTNENTKAQLTENPDGGSGSDPDDTDYDA